MIQYQDLLRCVLQDGEPKPSRAGPTVFLPHQVIQHDCRAGFPVLTGRKFAFKTMAAELDCFIHGLSLIDDFHARECHIWDANLASFNARTGKPHNRDLGLIYGRLWRGPWKGSFDQLQWVMNEAKRDPTSRRLLVSAWVLEDVADGQRQALPCCHTNFQLTLNDGYLDLCFYMRSVDLVLGLPFDLASYALLQAILANELTLEPRYVTGFLADAHIYDSNRGAALEYLDRKVYTLPKLAIDLVPGDSFEAFHYTKASLLGYKSGLAISTPMAD